MQTIKRKINLNGHKNPEKFLEEMNMRCCGDEIFLSLDDSKNLWVEISANLHTQEQINVFSYIYERANEGYI